jgi:hypothetical protein
MSSVENYPSSSRERETYKRFAAYRLPPEESLHSLPDTVQHTWKKSRKKSEIKANNFSEHTSLKNLLEKTPLNPEQQAAHEAHRQTVLLVGDDFVTLKLARELLSTHPNIHLVIATPKDIIGGPIFASINLLGGKGIQFNRSASAQTAIDIMADPRVDILPGMSPTVLKRFARIFPFLAVIDMRNPSNQQGESNHLNLPHVESAGHFLHKINQALRTESADPLPFQREKGKGAEVAIGRPGRIVILAQNDAHAAQLLQATKAALIIDELHRSYGIDPRYINPDAIIRDGALKVLSNLTKDAISPEIRSKIIDPNAGLTVTRVDVFPVGKFAPEFGTEIKTKIGSEGGVFYPQHRVIGIKKAKDYLTLQIHNLNDGADHSKDFFMEAAAVISDKLSSSSSFLPNVNYVRENNDTVPKLAELISCYLEKPTQPISEKEYQQGLKNLRRKRQKYQRDMDPLSDWLNKAPAVLVNGELRKPTPDFPLPPVETEIVDQLPPQVESILTATEPNLFEEQPVAEPTPDEPPTPKATWKEKLSAGWSKLNQKTKEKLKEVAHNPYIQAGVLTFSLAAINALAKGDQKLVLGASTIATTAGFLGWFAASELEYGNYQNPEFIAKLKHISYMLFIAGQAGSAGNIVGNVLVDFLDKNTTVSNLSHPPTHIPNSPTSTTTPHPSIPHTATPVPTAEAPIATVTPVGPEATATHSTGVITAQDVSQLRGDWPSSTTYFEKVLEEPQGWQTSTINQNQLLADWLAHLKGHLSSEHLAEVLNDIRATQNLEQYLELRKTTLFQKINAFWIGQ